MGFRDNLRNKIDIKALAGNVIRSINPVDAAQRIEIEAMRQLLEMGAYAYQGERDLDFYRLSDNHILLLDNELKIYNTTVDDVALRKSPTVKEMISIRNAIKILNDKDVVISRKADTVKRVQQELIENLDLSYSEIDIESMANDGIESLKNNYADGVVDILSLFAELLGFVKAPKVFQIDHNHIWGKLGKSDSGDSLFGPIFILGMMQNSLKMIQSSISSADKQGLHQFRQIAKGEEDADFSGEEVLNELFRAVIGLGEHTR